jgi:hypothetical protein
LKEYIGDRRVDYFLYIAVLLLYFRPSIFV